MDSTELRLILLGAGIILIFGIYAWERRKRRQRNRPRRAGRLRRATRKTERTEPERREPTAGVLWPEADNLDELEPDERREPFVTAPPELEIEVEPVPEMEPESAPWPKINLEPKLEEARKHPPTVDDWLDAKARETHPVTDEPQPQDTEPPSPAPAKNPLPPVLVIHVVSRVGDRMSGDLIMSVARDIALVPGDMDILHHHDEATDQVIFSVASMVEPGTFSFADMSGFSTPGLVLFAQLPGVRPALNIYDDMLAAAERLAALLDARLLDERRRPLTREARERMRQDLGAGAPME